MNMLNKSFFFSILLCIMMLVATVGGSCAGNAGSTGNAGSAGGSNTASNKTEKQTSNADAEKLWTMLSGYWSYIDTSDEQKSIYDFDIFNYFGYDDDQKPVSFVIWGFEGSEREYTTQVTAINEQKYRITAFIPANEEGGQWWEPHEAITKTYEIDLSRYADKRIALSSDGNISEWEYAGKEMPIIIASLDDVEDIKGNIVKVCRYEDRTGRNLVVLTETDVVSRPDPADNEYTLRSKELFARRYVCQANEETVKSVWQVTDFVRDCSLEDMSVSFKEDAFRVTDLNGDGLSEVWMTYTLTCRSDPSPKTMKIIMYEGDRKYAVRGETRSLVAFFDDDAKNEYAGGDYVMDAAFANAPPAFTSFAKELWEQYKNE